MPCVWWNPFIAFWDIWGMFQHFVQISLRTQEFWVDDRSLFVHCNCSYNLERAIRGGGVVPPQKSTWIHGCDANPGSCGGCGTLGEWNSSSTSKEFWHEITKMYLQTLSKLRPPPQHVSSWSICAPYSVAIPRSWPFTHITHITMIRLNIWVILIIVLRLQIIIITALRLYPAQRNSGK